MSILADRIVKNYRDGSEMIEPLIYADSKQIGKSSYSLQVAHEVFEKLDYPNPWDHALSCMFLEPKKFAKKCGEITEAVIRDRSNKVPALIFDDAGVGASGDLYWTNRETYYQLKKLLQTIGTITQSFIITATSPDSPTSMMVDDRNVTVKIIKDHGDRRIAKGFISNKLPWGKNMEQNSFRDSFGVKLPDDVYKDYEDGRLGLTKKTVYDLTGD